MATLTPEQIEEQRARAERIANACQNGAHHDIDLSGLLDEVCGFIRRYTVMGDHHATVTTLWVAHGHAIDAADATPYLSITSPEKRSGKSRLLEVLDLIVARPWLTGRTSPAALYRKIDADGATLLLDESDAAFKSEKEYGEALRGVLNTGWRRSGTTTACVGHGANITTRDFNTFGPKAIAGIGGLPDTIEDRAIKITMKRRAPGEPVDRFRRREAAVEAGVIRKRLERWATSAMPMLADARPPIPPELDDRAAEGWEVLFSIADMAGGEWPGRARDAALALSVGDEREDDSLGVRLLIDIRGVFDEAGGDAVFTRDLLAALNDIETAPWGDMKGRPLDARGLARMLKRYEIKPVGTVRQGDATAKGYARANFEDAWARYCPPASPKKASQASQVSQTADSNTKDVTDVTDVTANAGMGAATPKATMSPVPGLKSGQANSAGVAIPHGRG